MRAAVERSVAYRATVANPLGVHVARDAARGDRMRANRSSMVMASPEVRGAWPDEWRVVSTPLDMIQTLDRSAVVTVVLAGTFARDHAITAFLRTHYPRVEIVVAVDGDPVMARHVDTATGG
jgi:hypothetical protein